MSLIFEGYNFYEAESELSLLVQAPSGTQDGDILMLVQTGDIGTFDAPAGWIEALADGETSYINISCWWGIVGQHITGSSWTLTAGNSFPRYTAIIRISGTIDDTCVVESITDSEVDGTRPYFTPPSLPLDFPYRPRILITVGGQAQAGLPWASYDNPLYSDTLLENQAVVDVSSNACSMGFAVAEDNAAEVTSVYGGRYYNNPNPQSSWRASTATIALIGPVLQQTDLLSPAQAF